MASDLPDTLRLREIKYGEKTTDQQRAAVARRFLEAGRAAEALDLFLLAGDQEGISEGRRLAIEGGQPVLLLMAQRAGQEVSPEEWRTAGEAAFREQRWREAFRCFTEAGDEAGLEKVREHLPDYDIYTPQGK